MRLRFTQWLFIILLLILVFYPEFSCKVTVEPYGIYLLDSSESMKEFKPPDLRNSKVPLKKFTFSGDEKGTAIGDAIERAAEKYRDASFMVIYSDGANTRGTSPLISASRSEIPVFTVSPESSPEPSPYISIYGPGSIVSGDSAFIRIHYVSPKSSMLNLKLGKYEKTFEVHGEGVRELWISPSPGRYKIRVSLNYEGEKLIERKKNLTVTQKRNVIIISGSLDWNYKFFKRFFEDNNYDVAGVWKQEEEIPELKRYDLVCAFNVKPGYLNSLREYIAGGGNLIVLGRTGKDIKFLPLIAPRLESKSTGLPVKYYLNPAGIRRESREIKVEDEIIAYMMNYEKGRVAQFRVLDAWMLKIKGESLYGRDMLAEVLKKMEKEFFREKVNLLYSDFLVKGEDARFEVAGGEIEEFFWDSRKVTVEDSVISIVSPETGIHSFRAVFSSTTLVDSVEITDEMVDRMALDTIMMNAIGTVSGGGKWSQDFNPGDFKVKRAKRNFNLRYNWFYISLLMLVLVADWILWMRK